MNQPSVPDAARAPALRGHVLRRVRVPVGSQILSIVVPDAASWRRKGVWTRGVERGGEPPYWTRIWLAAVASARLVDRCGDLSGHEVCDLGCGLGLPGTTAARSGAHVTFVDQAEHALAFARWNGARHARERAPREQRIDWARADVAGCFDMMLLADVTYRLLHHAPLLRQLDRCLAANGVVVHTDPVRDASSEFLRTVAQRYCVATARRLTTLADERGEIRIALAAREATSLQNWLSRCGGRLAWEVHQP